MSKGFRGYLVGYEEPAFEMDLTGEPRIGMEEAVKRAEDTYSKNKKVQDYVEWELTNGTSFVNQMFKEMAEKFPVLYESFIPNEERKAEIVKVYVTQLYLVFCDCPDTKLRKELTTCDCPKFDQNLFNQITLGGKMTPLGFVAQDQLKGAADMAMFMADSFQRMVFGVTLLQLTCITDPQDGYYELKFDNPEAIGLFFEIGELPEGDMKDPSVEGTNSDIKDVKDISL